MCAPPVPSAAAACRSSRRCPAGPGLFRIVLPEAGLWAFGLLCGREPRPLSPLTMQIGPGHAGKEVRFSVR